MYNSYDKPTQLKHREHPKCCGCCHHDCLNGCVRVPTGTRPFVQCLRPELGPWNAQVPWCGTGSTSGNPRTSRLRRRTQMTRQSGAWLHLGASPGMLFRTGSKRKYVWDIFSYVWNSIMYNYIILNKA